jgi:hypothetical protein
VKQRYNSLFIQPSPKWHDFISEFLYFAAEARRPSIESDEPFVCGEATHLEIYIIRCENQYVFPRSAAELG